MILLGIDKAVDKEIEILKAGSIGELKKFQDTHFFVVLNFQKDDLSHYCKYKNFGLKIKSLEEFVLASNTNAKYAFCSKELAPTLQKCADAYLTDIKVIVEISTIKEIEWAALEEIDGVHLS